MLVVAATQARPMCQRRVECCSAGTGAEELRLMSLRTRCSADQRRRPHFRTGRRLLVRDLCVFSMSPELSITSMVSEAPM
jgi:hypothetical protein